jgi:hypothetical protein
MRPSKPPTKPSTAMPALPEALAQALSKAESPGDFYATGSLDIHPFRLEVDSIGQIALPLWSPATPR